ncbi:TadE/TadG family type IV pilus assembly protein [Sphingobium baderi]|uniref:TadE/TadG family type IV pilus assembly protein n=1 Tax=Sphingobium baderi TaxID=1332080 RepID=UPI002B4088B2|nr:TadE/TadG family type IV pilus assembly protein [Sphingobium baderi]WRD78843.1 TadE/TadG family type IV pilus assembly protein [Sphingobium baderi]
MGAAAIGDKGIAALEFALLFPLLLAIILSIYDIGRAVHFNIRLAEAARLGAEYGLRAPSDDAGVANTVMNTLPGWTGVTVDPVERSCVCPGSGPALCSSSCPVPMTRYLKVRVSKPLERLLIGPSTATGETTVRLR